ncbi:uncharacterized protein MELLADRAFT_67986 [Melampsora larici-populina 98AG31]|uniref:Uncharacterized protein n=1 Tax=Melampsora larici-populina (strain 98AG31 / pathotype 3-4-7) TaxID=747676 RepID=F4S564_MELLP|nr:uncharacterized protein MELLADRAFT_67986 [Melampsora larici-populina 98AG31]EGG00216.1 hypothetical protein MELLADRAFT_67986 [Melampsora larici-populina 98AG31]
MALPAQPIRSLKKRKNKKMKKTALGNKLDKLNSQEAQASAAIMAKLLGQSTSNRIDEIQNKDHCIYEGGQDSVWTDDEDATPREYVSFQARTQREQAQMRAAAPLIFSEFMRCSKRTYQWGDEESWNRDWKAACKCTTDQQERSIDVVDITCQFPNLS